MPVSSDSGSDREYEANDGKPANACRICMLEGTEANPLFHPCKCKGSIKYIHQSCLIEWLQSKNVDISKPGADLKCSICNHPIQFKVVYDEAMPDKIPLVILIKKGFYKLLQNLNTYIKLSLISVLFVIGLPLSWNVWGKLFTAALDDFRFPNSHPWYINLVFGFEREVPETPTGIDIFFQLLKNYRFSVLQLFMILAFHLIVYFQYDMVVREPVFKKMILHKIGPKYTKKEFELKTLRERFPNMNQRDMDLLINTINAHGRENRNESNSEDEDENNDIALGIPDQLLANDD